MKKNIIIAALLLVFVSINASASSYFTAGDSIRINPNKLDGYQQLTFTAHLEGYCDAWSLVMTYPSGVTPKLVAGITSLDGMTVSALDRDGFAVPQAAYLQVSAEYRTIASQLYGEGYWDWDGDGWLESYGSIKWEPGTHEMFSMNFYIDPSFRKGELNIAGHITSGNDRRGPVLSDYYFIQRCWVWVGYERGDVSGDGRINIADVVLLVDYLLDAESLDEFQIAAADADANGHTGIADVTTTMDMMLEGGE